MSIQILSHTSTPSESVKRLLDALNQNLTVLNYGNGVDKLTQYAFFKEKNLSHPEWTTSKDEALQWQNEGHFVVARERIKSQAGGGVYVIEPGQLMPDAKVYTKYLKKKREFRVNIFKDKVVNIREKVKQKKEGSTYIRNTANGYTTTHCKPMSLSLTERLKALALEARKVSKSDFIGVDIGYNEFYDNAFVLEVNSGPSIEGSSVLDFVKAIQNAN